MYSIFHTTCPYSTTPSLLSPPNWTLIRIILQFLSVSADTFLNLPKTFPAVFSVACPHFVFQVSFLLIILDPIPSYLPLIPNHYAAKFALSYAILFSHTPIHSTFLLFHLIARQLYLTQSTHINIVPPIALLYLFIFIFHTSYTPFSNLYHVPVVLVLSL